MVEEVTTDLLDDIFASVDAREANPDIAANSCDEEDDSDSDLDVPKALPPSTAPAVQPRPKAWTTQELSNRRAPLTPTTPNLSNVQSSAGRGRMVYQVSKPTVAEEAFYFMIQWYVFSSNVANCEEETATEEGRSVLRKAC